MEKTERERKKKKGGNRTDPHRWSTCSCEQKNSCHLHYSNLGHPACNIVTVQNELLSDPHNDHIVTIKFNRCCENTIIHKTAGDNVRLFTNKELCLVE
jgi:hypothetical protein